MKLLVSISVSNLEEPSKVLCGVDMHLDPEKLVGDRQVFYEQTMRPCLDSMVSTLEDLGILPPGPEQIFEGEVYASPQEALEAFKKRHGSAAQGKIQ